MFKNKSNKKTKENTNFGIKVGSEELAFWTDVKQKCEAEVKALERALKFNQAVYALAVVKIENEQRKD